MFDIYAYEKDPMSNRWVITKNGDLWLRVSSQYEAEKICKQIWEEQKDGET